jgi:hypothetical protein
MLGDAGRGIPTSVFTITEMHYPVAAETGLSWHSGPGGGQRPAAASSKHFKGLLETKLYAPGTPEDDRTVVRSKMGYPSMQAVTAIFDKSLPVTDIKCQVTGTTHSVSAFVFRRADGASVLALWRDGHKPGDYSRHEAVDVVCPGVNFGASPRFVDLLTRAAYATSNVVAQDTAGAKVTGLPLYDSPVLVADARLINAR